MFCELSRFDNTNGQERDDIEAEIALRDDEPPYSAVPDQREEFANKTARELERIEIEEPDCFDEGNRNLMIEFLSFLRQLKNPSA